MPKFGLLVDYDLCTGCHACEIACKEEHGLPLGQWGIKLTQIGPFRYGKENWVWDNVPVPTDLCDLCSERVKHLQQPTCVKHCQAGVMKYGSLKELVEFMKVKSKTVLYSIR